MTSAAFRAGLGAIAVTLLALTCIGPSRAHAHGIAGNRFFPVTLTIDDPAVSDELSLPTFVRTVDSDGTREHDISFEYDKRITENFGVAIGDTYSHVQPGSRGFQNLEITLKYLAYVNAEHETMMSVGLGSEIGGTGAHSISDGFTTLTPQVYFGKGFGDLPVSLDPLRPFAVTGQVGVAIPTRARSVTKSIDPDGGAPDIDVDRHPTVLNWGFSLQYSLPYLNANVREIQGPDCLKRLIPLVEVALQTPVAYVPDGGHVTTGTVAPGVLYECDTYQLGVEALMPINRASGKHPGFIAQMHFFIDDILPETLGRPIFP